MTPSQMIYWLLLFWAQLAASASFLAQQPFAEVKPIHFSTKFTEKIPLERGPLILPIEQSTKGSSIYKLPASLQLVIFFEYLRPRESLRLRCLNSYLRQLVDCLIEHRLVNYCGAIKSIITAPLLWKSISLNHLPLLASVFPSIPSAALMEEGPVGLISLLMLAYFINADLHEFRDRITCIIERWPYQSGSWRSDLVFFKITVLLERQDDRFGHFKSLSGFLHKMHSQLALDALYSYCRNAPTRIKELLFLQRCKNMRERDEMDSLRDFFFNNESVSPMSALNAAFKSKNGFAIVQVVRLLSLPLPLSHNNVPILLFMAKERIFHSQIVDCSVASRELLDSVLPHLLHANNEQLMHKIVLEADLTQLNPLYSALRDIYSNSFVPENHSPSILQILPITLAALNSKTGFPVFTQLLHRLPTDLMPILIYQAISSDSDYLKYIFVDNCEVPPVFWIPSHVIPQYNNDELSFNASRERVCVVSHVVAFLGNEMTRSFWLKGHHLCLLGTVINDNYMGFMWLRKIAPQLDGSLITLTSLSDLQQMGHSFAGFHADFFPLYAQRIVERQEWTLLELSIVLVNPTAVQCCLKHPRTMKMLADSEHRERIHQLAALIPHWITGEPYLKRSKCILKMIFGDAIDCKNDEDEYSNESTSNTSTSNASASNEPYLILDPLPSPKYRTLSPSCI